MRFRKWLEMYQPVFPFLQEEDPPDPAIARYKNRDNYVRAMSKGGRQTEDAAKGVVAAPPHTWMAPQQEQLVQIVPSALIMPSLGPGRPEYRIAFVHLETPEPVNPNLPQYNKKQYRVLAYWQNSPTFDKELVFDQFTKPVGGIVGMGGQITHAWVRDDFRGQQPNLYQALMTFAKKIGIHGLMPEEKPCERCGTEVKVQTRPEKCPKCGNLVQPLTSRSFRAAQAKYDWKRSGRI